MAILPNEDRGAWPWWLIGLLGLALVVSGTIFFIAARDSFWFDEIWSLQTFAQSADSPWKVFGFHHDNNHQLVTLWMYFWHPQRDWLVYRIPSIAAGLGTIVLSASIARRWSNRAALIAICLTASSFVLVTYSSEARGYALAGFFSLAAWFILDRYLVTQSIVTASLFWALVVLGFLSHATFLFFYCGALAWTSAEIAANRRAPVQTLKVLARLHLLPLAFLLFFYLVHLRVMKIGGGPQGSLLDVVRQALALSLGGDARGFFGPWSYWIALVIAVVGLGSLVRSKSKLWILFFAAIFAAPALILITQRPSQIYPRYFYIPLLLLLLLYSYVVSQWLESGAIGKIACAASLALIVQANARQTIQFLAIGRGQYVAALDYMAEHSTRPEASIQSDHDYESERILPYYLSYLPPGLRFVYSRQTDPGGIAPEWTVVYGQTHPFRPHPSIVDGQGRPYRLRKVFPYSGLSGYHWAVYQLTH